MLRLRDILFLLFSDFILKVIISENGSKLIILRVNPFGFETLPFLPYTGN